jgi:1-aminocyclopropane-1-carboxylate deaminase
MRYPGAYIIPEGGAGPLGIRGSEDILQTIDAGTYTHILCAIGTGTMFLGLVRASLPRPNGHRRPGPERRRPTLCHGRSLHPLPEQMERASFCTAITSAAMPATPGLLDFMNEFYRETGVPSDIVYTGKLFYAIRDSIRKDYFPEKARLLLIHSGGLQGNLSLAPGRLNF